MNPNSDGYGKTIKCKFKDIIKENVDYIKLNDCINRANNAFFICSYFIRFFILYKQIKDFFQNLLFFARNDNVKISDFYIIMFVQI